MAASTPSSAGTRRQVRMRGRRHRRPRREHRRLQFGAREPDVGGKPIEAEHAAAVDGDGDFGASLARERCLRQRVAQVRRRARWRRKSLRDRDRRADCCRTGMPSSAAMPSAAMAAAKRGADAALNPRTWMLPRAVTSMTPLPCSPRRRAQLRECGKRDGADRHQPHQQSVAGRHRRRQSRDRRRGGRIESVHGHARSPRATPRDRHRRRCGADAKSRAAARRRAARQSRRQPAGFSRSRNARTVGIGDIGLVQQIEQFARRPRRWFRRRRPAGRRFRQARRRRAGRGASARR